jgi:hypothetical protein
MDDPGLRALRSHPALPGVALIVALVLLLLVPGKGMAASKPAPRASTGCKPSATAAAKRLRREATRTSRQAREVRARSDSVRPLKRRRAERRKARALSRKSARLKKRAALCGRAAAKSRKPRPAPAIAPFPAPPPGGTTLTGVHVNPGYFTELAAMSRSIGAKFVRIEFPIGTDPAAMREAISAYDSQGITVLPLAGFPRSMATADQARSLGRWAAAFGPGGSFWTGDPTPHPTPWIEFGNETSQTWQYGDAYGSASYNQRARDYALRFKDAALSVAAANRGVGLLAQADDETPHWDNAMFAAVPRLELYVAGWTVHPYGPTADAIARMDRATGYLAAHGAAPSAARPVFITEDGIASDNGRCLSDNYGWNSCMSYSAAGQALESKYRELTARYGGVLRMYMLYSIRDERSPGTTSEREDYFGMVQNGGGPKGDFTAAIRRVLEN